MSDNEKIIWIDRGFQPTWLCYLPDVESIKEFGKIYDIPEEQLKFHKSAGRCVTILNEDKTSQIIGIYIGLSTDEIKEQFNDIRFQGVVLHECVHAYQDIISFMGETSPGVEFEAYFIQGLYQEVMAAIAKYHGIPIEGIEDDDE